VISQIRGVLHSVGEEELTLGVGPFDITVLIAEHARRHLQGKLGELISLHTIFDIEGNQMSSRMAPRLIGFLTPIDREFFEILCSVDGMGVRKSLRAMVRPVRELARMIQEKDVKMLATFPGIGEAMAERIVAKTRRKVGKFSLIVGVDAGLTTADAGATVAANGDAAGAEPDVIQHTFAALLSVGHTESQARELIDRALSSSKRKYRSVADMIEAIYRIQEPEADS
jgi:Holliday junction DNA helicase RuvA